MLFSTTFFAVEVKRQLRNPFTLVFTLGMPIAMYLLFGAAAEYGNQSAGNANVAFYVMVSMAAFGAATAMTSICALAAVEVGQGWGRQIALTPLTTAGYALVKLSVALLFSCIATVCVYVVGALTGAKPDAWWLWPATAAIVLGGGLIFGLFGLGTALAFNSDTAASLSSVAITLFGFVGNVFMPLSGGMLAVAKFTPMYGYAMLARWPVNEGVSGEDAAAGLAGDPIWIPIVNIVAWALIFALLVRFGVLRSRRRR